MNTLSYMLVSPFEQNVLNTYSSGYIYIYKFYCAFGVYKMYKINYKIVSETNFNKYLHCGTSWNEYVDIEMGGNNGSEK